MPQKNNQLKLRAIIRERKVSQLRLANSKLEFECDIGGMNDVIAPKQSSFRPGLVEAAMFLRLNMNMFLNNPADVAESPIQNTLIPSHHELPNDIDDSNDNDNENEEDDDDDNDEEEEDHEDNDLSSVSVGSEETNYM